MEFAPGIKKKGIRTAIPTSNKRTQWEFVVQEHTADRRGRHLDLRLAPPGGPGFSWVVNELPKAGGRTHAIRTYDHTVDYFDFKGEIKSGYGKGSVTTVSRGTVEILKSSPTKITFYWYGNTGTSVTKYTLIAPYGGDTWILLNHTTTIALDRQKGISALKYKDVSGNYKKELGDFSTPKLDGASSVVVLFGGKTPSVYSKRISKKTGQQIEYTPKIPKLLDVRTPKDFGTTVLRAEVFGIDVDGKEIPNRTLGGMLNASVQKSRTIQKLSGTPLRLAGYDVVKYKGKNVSNLDIQEKYKILEEINRKFPIIENPLQLNKTIPFIEGTVVWRNGVPLKVKNKKEYDVVVTDIFPSIVPGRAGGFSYSLTKGGLTVGKVGTGFTHDELIEMMINKKDYIGRVAKVYSQEQPPSGALRAPSFNEWHLEKNASLKIIPAFGKALKETFIGGRKLSIESGAFSQKKKKMVKAYKSLEQKLGADTILRARIKSNKSIFEKEKIRPIKDISAFQLKPTKTMADVHKNEAALVSSGAKNVKTKIHDRPGYRGANTSFSYHGQKMEMQQIPSRRANLGQILQHNAMDKAENAKFSKFDKAIMNEVGSKLVRSGSKKWKN